MGGGRQPPSARDGLLSDALSLPTGRRRGRRRRSATTRITVLLRRHTEHRPVVISTPGNPSKVATMDCIICRLVPTRNARHPSQKRRPVLAPSVAAIRSSIVSVTLLRLVGNGRDPGMSASATQLATWPPGCRSMQLRVPWSFEALATSRAAWCKSDRNIGSSRGSRLIRRPSPSSHTFLLHFSFL